MNFARPAILSPCGAEVDGRSLWADDQWLVRRELPSGTVTFLFTDVEGSTRLLHELGPRRTKALAEHRRCCARRSRAHGGVEVDTQGDAFFVAFPTAPGALAGGGRGATSALAAGPIRVRIGVHTGTPPSTDGGLRRRGRAPGGADRGGRARRAGARLAGDGGAGRGDGLRDLGEHGSRTCRRPSASTSSAGTTSRRSRA